MLCVCGVPHRLQEVNKQWNESPFIADNVNALSPEARDLLDRIFVLDPTKRTTIPEIMKHPWFVLSPVFASGSGTPSSAKWKQHGPGHLTSGVVERKPLAWTMAVSGEVLRT